MKIRVGVGGHGLTPVWQESESLSKNLRKIVDKEFFENFEKSLHLATGWRRGDICYEDIFN